MKYHRIIPKLDIKGESLVKGIHLEGLRVLGLPENFAYKYYLEGADEIFFQDTVASLYGRNSLLDIISKTAKNIFVPLTVGGGIRNIDDIKNILRAGADKVSINTAAVENPNLINEASNIFGSSTIVLSIEAVKQKNNSYLAYTDNGREHTGIDIFNWALDAQMRGAGEIFLTSVDKEGTGEGYDIDLIKKMSEIISIPLISHGGAGNLNDIKKAFKYGKSDALSMASILHYGYLSRNKGLNKDIFINGNTEFLNKNNNYNKFGSENIQSIKNFLLNNDIDVYA